MRHLRAVLVACLACQALSGLAGCAGDAPKVRIPDKGLRADWFPWIADRGQTLPLDGADRSVDKHASLDQRQIKADQLKPDQKANPCAACTSSQVCLNNQCYTKCTPTGPCLVDSSTCKSTELCIEVTGMSYSVCMKATAAQHGACDIETLWCPNHLVCVTPNGSTTGTCEAQCTVVGAACSGGGTCVDSGGCMFCTPY